MSPLAAAKPAAPRVNRPALDHPAAAPRLDLQEIDNLDLKLIAEEFDRDGFAIIPEVFPAIDLREIERQMSHYIEQVVPHMNPGEVYYEDSGSRPLKALHRMQQHSEFFSQLGEDPRLMTIMGSVWPDSEVAVEGVMCFFQNGSRWLRDTAPPGQCVPVLGSTSRPDGHHCHRQVNAGQRSTDLPARLAPRRAITPSSVRCNGVQSMPDRRGRY